MSTIRETLRINLYGESRRDSKRRNNGRGWERNGREGGKRLSGIAVRHEEEGVTCVEFIASMGIVDCNKKEMLNVMPGSFHELAIFEGR